MVFSLFFISTYHCRKMNVHLFRAIFSLLLALLVVQGYINFVWMYATVRRAWHGFFVHYTDWYKIKFFIDLTWSGHLSVCTYCGLAFKPQATTFVVFWWSLVYLRVLAPGRTLWKWWGSDLFSDNSSYMKNRNKWSVWWAVAQCRVFFLYPAP